jgi:hypothetical protein
VTEERCERTELIKSQCAHCLGHADPAVDVEPERRRFDRGAGGPTIDASYPGRCPECDEPIRVGDPITLTGGVSNTATYWVCAGCAP